MTKFGKTRAVFTQFLVVRKWLTGQKEGEKRGKWFPKWLTESPDLVPKMYPKGILAYKKPLIT